MIPKLLLSIFEKPSENVLLLVKINSGSFATHAVAGNSGV